MDRHLFELYSQIYAGNFDQLTKLAADSTPSAPSDKEPMMEVPARALYTLLGAMLGLGLGPMLGAKDEGGRILSTLTGGTLGLFSPDILGSFRELIANAAKYLSGKGKDEQSSGSDSGLVLV